MLLVPGIGRLLHALATTEANTTFIPKACSTCRLAVLSGIELLNVAVAVDVVVVGVAVAVAAAEVAAIVTAL